MLLHHCMASRIVPSKEALRALRALVHPQIHGAASTTTKRCVSHTHSSQARSSSISSAAESLAFRSERAKVKQHQSRRFNHSIQSEEYTSFTNFTDFYTPPEEQDEFQDDLQDDEDDEDDLISTSWDNLPSKQRNPAHKGRRKLKLAVDNTIPVAQSRPGAQFRYTQSPPSLKYTRVRRRSNHAKTVYDFREHIRYTFSNQGCEAAADRLFQDLERFASGRQEDQWLIAHTLYWRCHDYIDSATLRPRRHDFLEQQMARNPPFFDALSILSRPSTVRPYDMWKHAFAYLDVFCHEYDDLAKQHEETWKVIRGLASIQILPDSRLLIPHLNHLSIQNQPDRAKEMIDHLHEAFPDAHLRPICYLPVIRGYVKARDWAKIDDLFYHLHQEGLTRRRPIQLNGLFKMTLRLHFAHYGSVEGSFDFLVHHMTNSGIIPSSPLSAQVISLLVDKGYPKLAVQHYRDRLNNFPYLSDVTGHRQLIYEIFYKLRTTRKRSTSDTLLNITKVFCQGAVRILFHQDFKILAFDQIKHDVAYRAHALHASMFRPLKKLEEMTDTYFARLKDHRTAMNYAYWLLEYYDNVYSRQNQSFLEASILKEELMVTLGTAQELVLILEDYQGYCHIYGPPDASTMVSAGKRDDHGILQDHVGLNGVSTGDIIEQIECYLQETFPEPQNIPGKRPKQSNKLIYEWLGPLLDVMRLVDCHQILLHLYNTHWRARIFNASTFEFWLYVASVIEDSRIIADILWAMVDQGDALGIVLHLRLFLLIQNCSSIMDKAANQRRRSLTTGQQAELTYLAHRVYRMYWTRIGQPHSSLMTDSPVKAWRQEIEKSLAQRESDGLEKGDTLELVNTWLDPDTLANLHGTRFYMDPDIDLPYDKSRVDMAKKQPYTLDVQATDFATPENIPPPTSQYRGRAGRSAQLYIATM